MSLMFCLLSSPYIYQNGGVDFELDQPSTWVLDREQEDSLVAFSDREGLEFLSINAFQDLLWGTCLEVFSENTSDLLEMGFNLVDKAALSKAELRQANATDGARFHFIKNDGEVSEHIVMVPIARDNLVLVLTFYLPRWHNDPSRLAIITDVISSFRFLTGGFQPQSPIPPPPPLN